MIKYIEENGIKRPVIMLDELLYAGDIREMRQALMDVLENCLLNKRIKNRIKSISLWYLIRLIDGTTI